MKARVRTVVVLVCVLVVLPVVGGLVYSFSVSAEAAARYYAEAIAQGRFEDAMAVEGTDADADSAVDLRRGRVSEPSSVVSVRVYDERDVRGRQGASIDFSIDGRTVTREIYLERADVPRPHVGMWRVVSGAAHAETVRAYGYASDVSVGGVSLGALGASGDGGATFPVAASTDGLWHAGSGGAVVYAYPGIYDVSVAKVSEHTQVAVDSVSGASTLSVLSGSREHQIDVTQDGALAPGTRNSSDPSPARASWVTCPRGPCVPTCRLREPSGWTWRPRRATPVISSKCWLPRIETTRASPLSPRTVGCASTKKAKRISS